MSEKDDWGKPFQDRYLICADALAKLEHALLIVGLSGNENFKRLQTDFIKHGSETLADISRRASGVTPALRARD